MEIVQSKNLPYNFDKDKSKLNKATRPQIQSCVYAVKYVEYTSKINFWILLFRVALLE